MVTQSQDLNKKYVRCAMCQARATQQHLVEDAEGILCVCDRCKYVLELKEHISKLEAEIVKYKAKTVEVN